MKTFLNAWMAAVKIMWEIGEQHGEFNEKKWKSCLNVLLNEWEKKLSISSVAFCSEQWHFSLEKIPKISLVNDS